MLPEGQLPEDLQELLDKEDPAFEMEMFKYADELNIKNYRNEGKASFAFLWNLYLHPSPLAKKTLAKLLSRYYPSELWDVHYRFIFYRSNRKINLVPFFSGSKDVQGSLRFLKAIFKLAEKKQDEEIWPVLAYQFDLGKRHHYSKKTRHYLRRRAWRYLRRLGEQGSAAYVRMATKVLLHYEPIDGRRKRSNPQSDETYRSYTHLWLFNHLLYHNSSRFTCSSSKYWQDQGADSYPIIPPEEREEAFPELWDQHPEKLFLLLTKAKAEPVLQFAGRALRMGNPDYVSEKVLRDLLKASFPGQRSFAAGSLLDRSDPKQPNWELLLSFLFSPYQEIRAEAKRFITNHFEKWEREQILQLIDKTLQWVKDHHINILIINDVLKLYRGALRVSIAQLATIHLAKWFLQAPNEPLQKFAADVLSLIDFERNPYTESDLLLFLTSQHVEVREAAQKRLEEEFHRLDLDGKWLAEYVSSADETSYPFIHSFLQQRRSWFQSILPQLIAELWRVLLSEDSSEQTQNFIIDDLFGDLFFDELKQTPLSKILFLLEHENSNVQAFAARLMDKTSLDPQQLSFEQLLSMAHHRVAAVRDLARRMMMEVEERITPDWMVNLIETDWTDTREWMFNYIQNLPSSSITPELIYGLLDTARSDVQALAKELVQKFESTLDLKELILRGCEHPDLQVQEYVLELAERIEWDEETLKQMELFFRIVLFRVHQGRQAKKKALSLLLKLSEQSLSFAKICTPILVDVARNQGVKDFETILVALTRIQAKYPECVTPIELV